MQNRSYRRFIKWGLMVAIVAALVFIGWQAVFKRPLVNVTLPEGTDAVELRQTVDGQKGITQKITSSKTIRLTVGNYTVAYFKAGRVVGLTQKSVHHGFKQTITDKNIAAATNKLSTIMHNHAKFVTPFGDGYLFVDTQTRGVSYADSKGIQDISQNFLLSQTPQDPDNPDSDYNTVINIQPTKDNNLLVTTTMAVFLVKSPTDVTRLKSYDKDFLYFTSSSYDPQSNRIFMLAAYHDEIYYYDLSNTETGPKVLYKAAHNVNRVVSGGGKVAVYFDDVPSTEPAVLKAYGLTRQLAPVIVEATSGKVLKTLDTWEGTTLASISDSGKYIVLKKKFATTMTIARLDGGDSWDIVAPDAGGVTWKGDKLYFGRDKALWSADPSADGSKITYVAAADETLIAVSAYKDSILATTSNNFIEKLVSADVDTDAQTAQKMKSLQLETTGYFIVYTAFGDTIDATIETKGSFNLGDTAEAVAASQAPEFAKAMAQLQTLPKSAINAHQKDRSITIIYQYASSPTDG